MHPGTSKEIELGSSCHPRWKEDNAVAEGSPPAKRRREGRNREYLHVPKHLHLRVPIAVRILLE